MSCSFYPSTPIDSVECQRADLIGGSFRDISVILAAPPPRILFARSPRLVNIKCRGGGGCVSTNSLKTIFTQLP